MSTSLVGTGPKTYSLERDSEGYREYKIVFRVQSTDVFDGPGTVLLTPGLPIPGTPWVIGNDVDLYVWCRPDTKVSPVDTNENTLQWNVEMMFSNKPYQKNNWRCQDHSIDDPLLLDPKISGTFSKFTEEATVDRFGLPIFNSAFEQIRGPQVEFDSTRFTVNIEQNLATFDYGLHADMCNTVNAFPLWGMPSRFIKLSNITFDRKLWGQCLVYYTRKLEFEVMGGKAAQGRSGCWDKDIMDEGTKVLNGHWDAGTGAWILDNIGGSAPDPTNPQHFKRAVDRNNNPTKLVLNGAGIPAGSVTGSWNWYVNLTGVTGTDPSTDTTNWQAVVGLITPAEWDATITYAKGNVVMSSQSGIVFISPNGGNVANPPDISASWTPLGFPMLGPGFLGSGGGGQYGKAGIWKSSGSYALGNLVNSPITAPAGNNHVEKYPGRDFTLLGIPLQI